MSPKPSSSLPKSDPTLEWWELSNCDAVMSICIQSICASAHHISSCNCVWMMMHLWVNDHICDAVKSGFKIQDNCHGIVNHRTISHCLRKSYIPCWLWIKTATFSWKSACDFLELLGQTLGATTFNIGRSISKSLNTQSKHARVQVTTHDFELQVHIFRT